MVFPQKNPGGFNKKLRFPEVTPTHNMLNVTGNGSSIAQGAALGAALPASDQVYFPNPQTNIYFLTSMGLCR